MVICQVRVAVAVHSLYFLCPGLSATFLQSPPCLFRQQEAQSVPKPLPLWQAWPTPRPGRQVMPELAQPPLKHCQYQNVRHFLSFQYIFSVSKMFFRLPSLTIFQMQKLRYQDVRCLIEVCTVNKRIKIKTQNSRLTNQQSIFSIVLE